MTSWRKSAVKSAVTLSACISALAFGGDAFAQHEIHRGVQIGRVDYQGLRGLEFTSEREGQVSKQIVPIHIFDAYLQVPVLLEGKTTILIPRLRYRSLLIVQPGDRPDLHIGVPQLGVTLRQSLSDGWVLLPSMDIGFASDFAGISREDFFGGGSLIVGYTFSKTFVFGLGAAASGASDGVIPLPLVLLKWAPRSDFWINTTLPSTFELGFAPAKRWEIGADARFDGFNFTLHSLSDINSVRPVTVTAGPYSAVHMFEGIHLRTTAGFASLLDFEIESTDARVTSSREVGWYLRAGLEYRYFP